MRFITVLGLLAVLGSFSCQSRETGNEELSANIPLPDDFKVFYERFFTDSLYQLDHITFPLEGIPDNAPTVDPSFRFARDSWDLHHPINFQESGFQREFLLLTESIVAEKITHDSGGYGMLRRYAKLGDDWYLIYYAGLNPLSQ